MKNEESWRETEASANYSDGVNYEPEFTTMMNSDVRILIGEDVYTRVEIPDNLIDFKPSKVVLDNDKLILSSDDGRFTIAEITRELVEAISRTRKVSISTFNSKDVKSIPSLHLVRIL